MEGMERRGWIGDRLQIHRSSKLLYFGPRLPSICWGAVVSRHQRPAREFGQMAHWPPGGLNLLRRSALLATVAAVCMAAVRQFKCAYLHIHMPVDETV